MTELHDVIIKCFKGFENTLQTELNTLGIKKTEVLTRAIRAKCTSDDIVKLNFCLRSALSIQIIIAEFDIKNAEDFYHKSTNLPWETYFNENDSFKVDNTVYSQFFNNSGFASLKLKDAIVDRFKKAKGFRPNVNLLKPKVYVHVSIHETKVSIGFNTSGEALFKRGYRQKTAEAPINEALAASMLLYSTWDRKSAILNPMCGSGTIAIEAALIALNKAPNVNRKYFGYENLSFLNIDSENIASIKKTLIDAELTPETQFIHCCDIDSEMIYATQLNASNAGVLGALKCKKQNFLEKVVKFSAEYIFINPPYDERLSLDNVEMFYEDLGSILKANYTGSKAYIITAFDKVYKHIQLKVQEKTQSTNGALPVHYFAIKLFKGDLKEYKTNNENY